MEISNDANADRWLNGIQSKINQNEMKSEMKN